MSDINKNSQPPDQSLHQNACLEPEGPPVSSVDEKQYTIQIMSKTAKGVEGHDQMSPLIPGHAQIVFGVEDSDLQISRMETYGLEPRSGTLDNFINKSTNNDPEYFPFGPGNDVRVNHPGDFPTTDKFPFQSEPTPITRGVDLFNREAQ